MEMTMVAYPDRAAFVGHVDSDFTVDAGQDAPLAMRLVDVEDMGSTPEREAFALHFHAPQEMPPHQGVYRVEHDELGAMDVFLVPVGREDGRLVLEAVFNRFVDVEKE
jgi:hypothetical protein